MNNFIRLNSNAVAVIWVVVRGSARTINRVSPCLAVLSSFVRCSMPCLAPTAPCQTGLGFYRIHRPISGFPANLAACLLIAGLVIPAICLIGEILSGGSDVVH